MDKCAFCGNDLPKRKGVGRKRKFCNVNCKVKFFNRIQDEMLITQFKIFFPEINTTKLGKNTIKLVIRDLGINPKALTKSIKP